VNAPRVFVWVCLGEPDHLYCVGVATVMTCSEALSNDMYTPPTLGKGGAKNLKVWGSIYWKVEGQYGKNTII